MHYAEIQSLAVKCCSTCTRYFVLPDYSPQCRWHYCCKVTKDSTHPAVTRPATKNSHYITLTFILKT